MEPIDEPEAGQPQSSAVTPPPDTGAGGGPDASLPRPVAVGMALRLLAFALIGIASFPPLKTGPLIFVALVPYLDAVRIAEEASARGRRAGRQAVWLLYLGGVFFSFLLLHWLLFVPPEEVTVPGLMIPATMTAGLYLGLFPLLAQAVARRAWRLGLPLWLGLPLTWVAAEYLRTQSQLGCPWGLLGYALTGTPVLMQLASWVGIFGVSLIVALVNGLLYAAWRARRRRRLAALGAGALVALLGLHGTVAMRTLPPAEELEVALIQGNIGHEIKFVREFRLPNVRRMVELSWMAVGADHTRVGSTGGIDSGSAAGPGAGGAPVGDLAPAPPETLLVGQATGPLDLIIWPETAAPCYFHYETGCLGLIERFADESGVPILTGFPDAEVAAGEVIRKWNAAGLILPDAGLVGQYNKVNLVPFGEAIPYQEYWTALQAIDFGEADFNRGEGFVPLRFPPGDFGVMICFESIFPAAGREAALGGATFFINITNDEWFGRSAGPYQHAAMAVVRSIECRRGLARAANTGVSFVVDRAGRVGPTTPLYTPRILRAKVELGREATPYMRIGDLLPQLCLVASVLLGLAGLRRRASLERL